MGTPLLCGEVMGTPLLCGTGFIADLQSGYLFLTCFLLIFVRHK